MCVCVLACYSGWVLKLLQNQLQLLNQPIIYVRVEPDTTIDPTIAEDFTAASQMKLSQSCPHNGLYGRLLAVVSAIAVDCLP